MAAPKGNQFWKLATKFGVKGVFQSDDDLVLAIDDYFQNGVKLRQVEVGSGESKNVIEIPVPTITGLAFFLGFASRQSFYDMEKREEYAYTIKRSRLFIEQEYEESLHFGNVAGAIFALKNMGWKDKTEVDQNVKLGFDNKTIEEIDKELDDLEQATKA